MPISLSEKQIQSQIAHYLVALGFLVKRANSGSVANVNDKTKRYTKFYTIVNNNESSGLSDLIAYKNCFAIFIEVKTATGKQTEKQKKFERLCKDKNCVYLVVRSFEDIERSMIPILPVINQLGELLKRIGDKIHTSNKTTLKNDLKSHFDIIEKSGL